MDALRGLAALMVLTGHARWLLAMSVDTYSARNGFGADPNSAFMLVLSFFRFHHEAVIVFFVVSGFAIHFRNARSIAEGSGNGRIALCAFARRRLRRLWPPLLAALIVTAIFDGLGNVINADYYEGIASAGFMPGQARSEVVGQSDGLVYSAESLIGGVLFATGTVTPAFGTNGALWSLSYEALYYVAYPLFLYLTWRFGHFSTFALSAALSAAAAVWTQHGGPAWLQPALDPLMLWVAWTAGAMLAMRWWSTSAFLRPGRATAVGLMAGLVAVACSLTPGPTVANVAGIAPPGIVRDWVWGLATWLLTYGLLFKGYPRLITPALHRSVSLFARVGRFSYTLYVVQLPVLFFLSALWLRGHDSLPPSPWLAIIGSALVIVTSMFLAKLVEYPFMPAARPASQLAREPIQASMPSHEPTRWSDSI